ncbi:MAG: preprotein translocase subunit YajC [Halobacteriovoraceae bacterium]|jgi:preprotein translocase subunit YajC|nr:preprotein translocase subunit YajC [Halobacteriovoraceae bacterium]MBT5094292.1 preprotein translocase subunit YajC [Halobacteriovoraceae bacterium]
MLDLIFSPAMAQATDAAGQPNPIMSFAPFIIIFFIFYFLMIKPQKKKLQEEQAMMSALGKGDEIYTKSGLLGTVHGITEKVITLEVSEGVKLKVLRSQIGGMAKKIFEKTEEKKDKK